MSDPAPVAALPMYDLPEIAAANDALWRRIAEGLGARGVAAPAALTRGRELAGLWRDPGLIFAQTCGYPLTTALGAAVVIVATPEYAFRGCRGVDRASLLVRAADDPRQDLAAFRGAVAAVNSWDSDSGMNLFRAAVAPLAGGRRFFSGVLVTGGHVASLEAVGDRRADLAAIDCVTFGLLTRVRPALTARVAVIGETPATPGLPYVMSARHGAATRDAVRGALFEALADPTLTDARAALGLRGARPLAESDYGRVLDLERAAVAAGYPQLA